MKRLVFIAMLLITACAGNIKPSPSTSIGDSSASLPITSPAFAQDAAIPSKYTCQGDDISPALELPEPPQGTKSMALIVDDPDAPNGDWVHWIVFNIPPETRQLPEGASQGKSTQANLPPGASQGKTSFNRVNYGGPCPPSGEHHYHFRLYAVDILIAGENLNKAALLKAMDGHILRQGDLVGLYKKQ